MQDPGHIADAVHALDVAADELCPRLTDCGCGYDSATACDNAMLELFEDDVALLDQGYKLDEACFRGFLVDFAEEGCSEVDHGIPPGSQSTPAGSCKPVFGDVEVGGACTTLGLGDDCVPDAFCTWGTCRERPTLGEVGDACSVSDAFDDSFFAQCVEGLYCGDRECKRLESVGDPCDGYVANANLFCDNGVVTTRKAAGEACRSDAACNEYLSCLDHHCYDAGSSRGRGESCEVHDDCTSNHCDTFTGTCARSFLDYPPNLCTRYGPERKWAERFDPRWW